MHIYILSTKDGKYVKAYNYFNIFSHCELKRKDLSKQINRNSDENCPKTDFNGNKTVCSKRTREK